ncbi:MAG: class II glutamine amidotransferase [Candidatus Thermoplasmatota archaeon]|nr:class II glutamine amidotransferase [Candidatus Thermoplasmatota archaeon]
MCRMVGVVFSGEFPIDTLSDLRRVAQEGVVPDEVRRGHRDGWGVVSFANGSPRYVGRSFRPMHTDPSFDSALQDVQKLTAPNILIGHARAASKGDSRIENAHPFVIDGVVLAHNGTIYDLEAPEGMVPKGESDSELLAMILSQRYSEEGDLDKAIRTVISEDIANRRFTAAVLLASDGRTLFGYRDFAREDRASYYDLRMARCKDYVAFHQESLMGYPGEVTQVSKGELVSVSLDLSVRRRIPH